MKECPGAVYQKRKITAPVNFCLWMCTVIPSFLL